MISELEDIIEFEKQQKKLHKNQSNGVQSNRKLSTYLTTTQ